MPNKLKRTPNSPLPGPTGSALTAWHEWVTVNYPYDWFAATRGGRPLSDYDRNLACRFARTAFAAGWVAAQNDKLTGGTNAPDKPL